MPSSSTSAISSSQIGEARFSRKHKNKMRHPIAEANLLSKQHIRANLNKPARHKRNRALQLLLLPEAVFLWIIGWSLCRIGSNKKPMRHAKPTEHEELASFVVLPGEELVSPSRAERVWVSGNNPD
jgi:hypothetical protein